MYICVKKDIKTLIFVLFTVQYIILTGGDVKDLYWYPASKSDLDDFPNATRRFFGYQLHLLQSGETPDDFKPLSGLGKGITGVYELRYRDEDNIYRVAYVAKLKTPLLCCTVGKRRPAKPLNPTLS